MDQPIQFKIDDREVKAALRNFEKSIPFAMSLIANRLAKKAREELRANLAADGIKTRDKGAWIKRQLEFDRHNWATKANPVATLTSPRGILGTAAQEEGGARRKPGLVPVVGEGGARETPTSPIKGYLRKNANTLERLLIQEARTPRGAKRFVRIKNTVYERTGPATKRLRGTGSRLVLSGPLVAVFRIPKAGVMIPHRWQLQRRLGIVQATFGADIAAKAIEETIAKAWKA